MACRSRFEDPLRLDLRAARFDKVLSACQALFAEEQKIDFRHIAQQLQCTQHTVRGWTVSSDILRNLVYKYKKLQHEIKSA